METQFQNRDCNFTIIEAAKHLKVSRSYLYQLIGAKKIKVAKEGTQSIIPGVEVQRYVKALAANRRAGYRNALAGNWVSRFACSVSNGGF